ncbi:PA14 domain-containing protein [Bacillus toyonensis]|nr:PA14 domain-containing protein [Bacillus toyonensis]MDT3495133.1 PA14 domain-containing protein [Bacillus toyonensis]MDT3495446.1 PA14 domain-containing protein [Bacillus toyonensis]MDT3495540.1 PA14 domain-containing protein [Bacillus toyonensis]
MIKRSIPKITKIVPVAFVLSTSFLVTPIQSSAEAHLTSKVTTNSEVSEGLLGYYFNDLDSKDLLFMTNQQTGDLSTLPKEVNDFSDKKQKNVQSAYWHGRIRVDEAGEYVFTTSANQYVKFLVDGNQMINHSDSQQKIKLEKDKFYDIKIEYQNASHDNQNFDLKLYWTTPSNKKELIPAKHLFLPEMKENPTQSTLKSKDKRVRVARSTLANEPTKIADADNDGIPDSLEAGGYTVDVKNGKLLVVPWLESLHGKKGLTKYYSSPLKWSTASDPYSDFQKVTGMIDKQVKHEARNPLVAAYPIVNVDMEQIVLSKNKTVSITDGASKSNTVSKSTSTSTTNSTTASVSAEVSASLFDFGAKVSTSFSSEHSSTVAIDNSKSDTSESNWSKTIGINTGESAYLAAGIRYTNLGTAPIYDVKPTNTIVLGNNQPIATVKAKENQLANVIEPGDYYPAKSQTPILLNAKDDFGSSPITLNLDQVNLLEREKKLKIDTDQVSGKIGKQQMNGDIITEGDWSTAIPQIKKTTARIILNDYTDDKPIERRVAAIDPKDPQERTKPEITLKEAVKLAFPDITEQDGKLYYKGQSLKDAFELVLDTNTANNISSQLNKMTDKDIYNVKLNAQMNIMINAKESNLVPSIEPILGERAITVTPNPKAPADVQYLLRDLTPNTGSTQIVNSGTNTPFKLEVSGDKHYHLIAKLPNGQEYIVYDHVKGYIYNLRQAVGDLFQSYKRGPGLSDFVTQDYLDTLQAGINTLGNVQMKNGFTAEINKAQILLNLKPSFISYYYKKSHNAYTFEFKTNNKAPENVTYKLSDLSKPINKSWTTIGKIEPNKAWWLDNLEKGKKYSLMAQLPDGKEYVLYEQK